MKHFVIFICEKRYNLTRPPQMHPGSNAASLMRFRLSSGHQASASASVKFIKDAI